MHFFCARTTVGIGGVGWPSALHFVPPQAEVGQKEGERYFFLKIPNSFFQELEMFVRMWRLFWLLRLFWRSIPQKFWSHFFLSTGILNAKISVMQQTRLYFHSVRYNWRQKPLEWLNDRRNNIKRLSHCEPVNVSSVMLQSIFSCTSFINGIQLL